MESCRGVKFPLDIAELRDKLGVQVEDAQERRQQMNAVIARGQWNQLRGGFRVGMGRLTDNSTRRFNGRMLKLMGRTQVTYGRMLETVGKRFHRLTGF
jgi:uncharacterized protein YjbJ (UPF0337 family)